MAKVYAIVSRPGPTEATILAELAAGKPAFTEHRRPAGEVTLRYLQGGSGPPLVLLHGRGHAATTWFPLLPDLGRAHQVTALDLPGFGHASASPFTGGGADAALRFFVDPVETLLLRMDLADAAIAGHSLGALVALELALRKRVRPRKLILIGGMGLGPEMTYASRAYFRAVPERMARVLGHTLFHRIHPPADTPLGRRLGQLHYELHTVPDGRVAAASAFNALCPVLGPAFHRRDRLRDVEAGTLLLWGERDEVFPRSTALAAADALPRATLCMTPLGHAPHLEDPARVLPEMLAFLEP